MRSVLRHLRAQPVAYLALFTSLSGSAVAVQAIDGRLLRDGSVDQTKVDATIQKRLPDAPPVCESGYIKSMQADGGVICGDVIATAADAQTLEGKKAADFLGKLEKAKEAEKADRLGDKTADDFLGKLEKAKQAEMADKLGDKTADDFLGKLEKAKEAEKAATADKAADADKLGGIDPAGFARIRSDLPAVTNIGAIAPRTCVTLELHFPGARVGDIVLGADRLGANELPPNVTIFLLGIPRDDRVTERFCNIGDDTSAPFVTNRRFVALR